MKGKPSMNLNMWTIMAINIAFSVSGLLCMKIGMTRDFAFSFSKGDFELKLNVILVIGLILYLLAFLTSLIAMRTINLSIYYPISAGLAQVVICILSYCILKENISLFQIIGIASIIFGVVMMNIQR